MTDLYFPKIIGHRGAKSHAPENTLAGFRTARRQGCSWVEFDIRLSSDGVVMVHHDDDLGRTVPGTGPFVDHKAADLGQRDAGSHFSTDFSGEMVPTFQEVTRLCRDIGLSMNVEMKECPDLQTELAVGMAEILREEWSESDGDIVISSFDLVSLDTAMAEAPEFPRGYLIEEWPENWQREAQRLDCVSIHAWDQMFESRDDVRKITDAGYPLLIFTVNDRVRAEQLLDWGATSIITDDPVALADL